MVKSESVHSGFFPWIYAVGVGKDGSLFIIAQLNLIANIVYLFSHMALL